MGQKLSAVLRFLFHHERFAREDEAELRYHLERETELNIRRGMTPEEAKRAAHLSVGSLSQIKEECREARAGNVVETLWQDIRYGVRVLVKNPGFALTAIITLALGIGVNTAIFSLVYGVLLRPLPYQHGGRLIVLHQQRSRTKLANIGFSPQEIFDYRDHCSALEAVVEYHNMDFLLLGNDSAERVRSGVVSANFFDVLGVKPLLGRTFVASDETPGAPAVLVLSNQYWETHQNSDPHIVGKVFQMNNRPHTVIGVLPSIPQYPAENDVYMPTSACPFRSNPRTIANRKARIAAVAFGRLKPGVSVEQAQSSLSVLANQMANAHPDVYPKGDGFSVTAQPLQDELVRRARTTLLVLLGGAGLVLLIACANVANLLLARLLRLERELAVRTALGASKMRLSRQLLTESVLLSGAAGALGLLLAPATLSLLVKFAEHFTTRAAEVRLDAPVLAFSVLVSVFTGLLFGLAPAMSLGRFGDALKQGGSRTTATRARQTMRATLLVAQVAVSFILLIGAGLMIRSFLRLEKIDPGIRPERVLSLRFSPSFSHYTQRDQIINLLGNVVQRVRSVPGVQAAALVSNVPFSARGIASGPGVNDFEIEGRPASKGELAPTVDQTWVSSAYFEVLRQPLLNGRDFNDHDDGKAPWVAVINQTMARHRWPTEDPIGKRVTFDHGDHWISIVGVVGDVKEYGLDRPISDEIYLPFPEAGYAGNVIVRTTSDPSSLTPAIRAGMHDVDPYLGVDQVDTIQHMEYESMASPRVTAILMGLFAGLALLISASGIASVMALSVSQRTNELGIRMALGAQRSSIVNMVVGRGLLLAIAGLALGIMGATGFTRFMSSMLFATSPTDSYTFLGVSLLFLGVAAVACYVPARQITAIDPLVALRQE
ncbi:MAG TPA: ABC transporter permease [Bryobacteraceae bacterium]|nr:ABC transporter permease [Bryobacteraceae bacterium]